MSHLFVNIFIELDAVENFTFTTRIALILALEAFGWMNEHQRNISPVSK